MLLRRDLLDSISIQEIHVYFGIPCSFWNSITILEFFSHTENIRTHVLICILKDIYPWAPSSRLIKSKTTWVLCLELDYVFWLQKYKFENGGSVGFG